MEPERKLLEEIWWTGVKAVSGYQSVAKALCGITHFEPTRIVAIGKAASPMMRAALDHFGKSLPSLLITKYNHLEAELGGYRNCELLEAAHPVPDENSLIAGARLLDFVSQCKPVDRLLLLVSGGASALAECLVPGLTLENLASLNRTMLAEGYDIHAMNARRRENSLIKGGKLLGAFKGAGALALMISDVQGDDPMVIGSGIGAIPKTAPAHFENRVIASNVVARMACEDAAANLDMEVIVNSEVLYGDLRELAGSVGETVRQGAPGVYIFGGEPTVELPNNPGAGGRNQALALAMAGEISGHENIHVLVGGTDGNDGPTNAAGGYVNGYSMKATPGGKAAFDRADSGSWLAQSGGIFVTGPTGTNVMDLMLVLKG